jgi:hypothetical protein
MLTIHKISFLFFSKANLEVEIIIYRRLLDTSGIEAPVIIAPWSQSIENEKKRKFLIKSWRKRSIGISKCEMKNKYYIF